MKTHGITHEQIAMVAVAQREWAAKNPRATMKTPITVEDVLNSRMIAYPFRILQCCTGHRRRRRLGPDLGRPRQGFSDQPVYILGTGESVENAEWSARCRPLIPRAFQGRRSPGIKEAGIAHKDVDLDDLRRLRASCRSMGSAISASCRMKRPGSSSPTATRGRAANCRSTPMARPELHAFRHGTGACTRCRKACGRCAASHPRRVPTRRSRCPRRTAACSPRRGRSFYERTLTTVVIPGAREARTRNLEIPGSPLRGRPGMTNLTGEPHDQITAGTKSSSSPARAAASGWGDRAIMRRGRRQGRGQRSRRRRRRVRAPVRRRPRKWSRKSRSAAVGPLRISRRSRKPSPASRIVKMATDHFGKLDGVVNNAGILRDMIFHRMSVEAFEIRHQGASDGLVLCRACRRGGLFREQESGSFVHFITSTSGLVGNFGQGELCAAKARSSGLSKSIALDMHRFKRALQLRSRPSPGAGLIGTFQTRPKKEKARRRQDPADWVRRRSRPSWPICSAMPPRTSPARFSRCA